MIPDGAGSLGAGNVWRRGGFGCQMRRGRRKDGEPGYRLFSVGGRSRNKKAPAGAGALIVTSMAAGLFVALAEQLQQQREQVDEVEIERQRAR